MKRKKYVSLFLSSIITLSIVCPINAELNNNEDKALEFYEKSSQLVEDNWNDKYFENMKLKVGQDTLKVDDEKKVTLSNDVEIKNNKIMVPAKEIVEISGQESESNLQKNNEKTVPIDVLSEKLGYTYEYDKKTKEIELSSPYQTMRLIVKLKNKNTNLEKYKVKKVVKGLDNIVVLQFDSIEKTKESHEEIEKDKISIYAQPDRYISSKSSKSTQSKKSSANKSWGTKYIQADQYASYLKYKNLKRNVVVGVVDSGIEKNHPFFKNRIISKGYDFVDNDKNPDDENGHGTHVSGIIVDCTKDLPIKILPVKVLDGAGTGTELNIANGIEYISNKGVNVINFSIGLSGHSNFIHEKINKAMSKDISFVIAAGNDNVDTQSQCPSEIKEAIVVSSIDSDGIKSYFSNYGNTVDVSAPGEEIKSAGFDGRYVYMSGTSMAAPHVSAVCAMYKLNNPNLTISQIEKLVKKNTKDLGKKGFDKYYGAGVPKLSLAIPDTYIKEVKNIKAKTNSYNSVKLTWDKVSKAKGYEIYRSTKKNGKYKKIKTTSSTNYIDKKLQTNKTYYYKIKAYKNVGSKKILSKDSSIVSAKPSLSKPTLSVKSKSKKAYIKWKKVKDISGYKIYRATKKDGKYINIRDTKNINSTSFINTNVKKNKTYYYKMRAYKKIKCKLVYSPYSDIKSVKIK